MSKKNKTSRKFISNFYIAGFTYYEGSLVFQQLNIGTPLSLKAETDNRYDENAVAIYFEDSKLGYIPRGDNKIIATLLNCGYDIFESYVQVIDACEHPEQQVKVVLYAVGK